MRVFTYVLIIICLLIISTTAGSLRVSGIKYLNDHIHHRWNTIVKDSDYDVEIDIIEQSLRHDSLYGFTNRNGEGDIRFMIDLQSRRIAYSTNTVKTLYCRKLLVRDIMDKNTGGSIIERFNRLLSKLDLLMERCNVTKKTYKVGEDKNDGGIGEMEEIISEFFKCEDINCICSYIVVISIYIVILISGVMMITGLLMCCLINNGNRKIDERRYPSKYKTKKRKQCKEDSSSSDDSWDDSSSSSWSD